MIDFEEAIRRLMDQQNLERGPAIDLLHKAYEANDPEIQHITDLSSSLNRERAKSIFERGAIGMVSGVADPALKAIRLGQQYAGVAPEKQVPLFGELAEKPIREQTETTPYVEGAGELVGSAAPFGALEKAGESIPLIQRAAWARRAFAGGVLGYADTGTTSGAEWGALGGVVIPPVANYVGGQIARGLGHVVGAARGLFGRADPDVIEALEKVPVTPDIGGNNTIVGAPAPAQPEPDVAAYATKEHEWSTARVKAIQENDYVKISELEADRPALMAEREQLRAKHSVAPVGEPTPTTTPAKESVLPVTMPPVAFTPEDLELKPGEIQEERDLRLAKKAATDSGFITYAGKQALKAAGVPSERINKLAKYTMTAGDIKLDSKLEDKYKFDSRLFEFKRDLDKVIADRTSPLIFANRYSGVSPGDFPADQFKDILQTIADNPKATEAINAWMKESKRTLIEKSTQANIKRSAMLAANEMGKQKGVVGRVSTTSQEILPPEDSAKVKQLKDEIAGLEKKVTGLPDDSTELSGVLDELNKKRLALDKAQAPKKPRAKKLPTAVVYPPTLFARQMSEDATPETFERRAPKVGPVLPEHERYGFTSAAEMAQAIRDATYTPFELWASGGKALRAELPKLTESLFGREVKPEDFSARHPEVFDAVQAIANRYPTLINTLREISYRKIPERQSALATTQQGGGRIIMSLNAEFGPDTKAGQFMMKRLGLKPDQGREYIATTLEHEITHVAQFHIEDKNLSKTFSTPPMHSRYDIGGVESQAEDRAQKLQRFFEKHDRLQRQVATIPDDIRGRILSEVTEQNRRLMKPIVKRAYNKMYGETTRVLARDWGINPEDMDDFDKDSRSLNDAVFDPDKLIPLYVKDIVADANRQEIKPFSSIRSPARASDDPVHQQYIGKIWDIMRGLHQTNDKFMRHATGIFKGLKITEADYDKVFEAVEGLRRKGGQLVQTLTNVNPRIDKIAKVLRDRIYDPLWEYAYGISRKAPEVLTELGLTPDEKTWRRIRAIQLGLPVKNRLLVERTAANRLKGMLWFDDSYDLRGKYVDGFITHQPIANERAALLNDIEHLDKLNKLTGYSDPATMDTLQKRIQRLSNIEIKMAKAKLARLPSRDTLPKYHYAGPFRVRDDPYATGMLVDKDMSHITGRWINGVVSKRAFDKSFYEFRKTQHLMAGSVKDYDITMLNNMRGIRGYREDIWIPNFVNRYIKKTGQQININDVRVATRTLLHLNNFSKLFASPVRFPLVQIGHVGLTDFVVDYKATAKGLAYFASNYKRAIREAMAAGVVERDSDMLNALDEVTPTNYRLLMKLATASSKFTDAFRKAVTYHGFRLQALHEARLTGDFKPKSVIRTYSRVPGRNIIAEANAYGIAATDVLQFRLRAEGKPQVFVGGAGRRLVGQFKTWPLNIMGLYADVIKSGDKAAIARMMGALFTYGGISMGTGTGLLYYEIRKEIIKHGDSVPTGLRHMFTSNEAGWQLALNQLGIGEKLEDINITSLRDPIGLPRSLKDIPSWMAGPTFGGIYDFVMGMAESNDEGRDVKSAISAISPQLRAGIDAYEEYKHGGVISPTGRMLAMRDPSSVLIRGLDLSPSIKTTRYQYRQDIITALSNNQAETASALFQEAQKKGIVFDKRDVAFIKSAVKMNFEHDAIYSADPERLLQ